MLAKLLQLKEELEGEFHTDHFQRSIYATDASVYKEMPAAVAIPSSKSD